MKTMYGRNIRVYFFSMILSYSRMKFSYFSVEPFDARKTIESHIYAFRYFGGRHQMIVYDQDKTMVISENLGDVIFVKEFEKFIKGTGFSIYLCKGYDPSTKGKVEKTVDFVKHKLVGGKGNVVTLPNIEKAPPSIEELLLKDFSKHDDANRFIKRMREQKLRYVYSQCRKLEKMRKYYSDKKIVEGMKYCLNIDVCTIFELSSWLVMDMGIDIAKPYLSSYTIRHYKDRALEIEKELKENGRS